MFVELYPHCTVIYSYPNSVRPPLPYVVLDFERIDPVGSFERIEDGILWQEKSKHIPFSAELVTESKTEHAAGVKKVGLSTAVSSAWRGSCRGQFGISTIKPKEARRASLALKRSRKQLAATILWTERRNCYTFLQDSLECDRWISGIDSTE